MTRKRYNIAAIVTALLLIAAVALTFVLGETVKDIVTGGGAHSAYAAEISVDEGYVANGDVASDYDPVAVARELGYDDSKIQVIDGEDGWSKYIEGNENTAGYYYYLAKDVKLTVPEGGLVFQGVLDGCGKTITLDMQKTDVTNDTGEGKVFGGMFSKISGGAVKNLKVDVTTFSIGVDNVGTIAGIIAGQSSGETIIQNVRVDLNYTPSGTDVNNPGHYGGDANPNYLYDAAQKTNTDTAHNFLILGGVIGDVASTTTIDEVTVAVDANKGCEPVTSGDDTIPGFGISGWRAADDSSQYYILGGFVGRINGAKLTMTNVNLEGDGKILNYNESEDSAGGLWGIGAKHRNNYGYAGGFVGEIMTNGAFLEINGLNYLFTGALGKTHMNKSNATGAIVGTGGTDSNRASISNVYYASTSTQRATWVMGDNETYNGGIVYDIGAPVYVSGGKLVIPAQQSSVWTEGEDVLYSVKDRDGNVCNVESYMIVADEADTGKVYLTMDMFANVGFASPSNQQDYGTLYTLNYLTMGSADIAEGFSYDAETEIYSFSKTYDGAANKKDVGIYLTAGEKNNVIDVWSGSTNSGNAGNYTLSYDTSKYAAAGVQAIGLTNAEGRYLVDEQNAMLCKLNVSETSQIKISIAKLPVTIAFTGEGNVTYGDSLVVVKQNNPVAIISVNGVDTDVTPDAFTAYSLGGYVEKTAAGTQITLQITDPVMNGMELNYEFTLLDGTTTVKQYQITGALGQDRFTTTEIGEGAQIIFVPSTELPDEVAFVYSFALSEGSEEWTAEMPSAANRYYVKVEFDDPNYALGTSVYTFTIIESVNVITTDKVVDGVYTIEYLNTVQKLCDALREAVDYDGVKEETDYFVYTIGGEEIATALAVGEQGYTVTATLKSQRYEDASVTFDVVVVTQKIYVTGENFNAEWAELQNKVYDGEAKTSFGLTTADEFLKNYAITYSAAEDGEYTSVSEVKNAGYYKISATSADPNYEIVDSSEGLGVYYVEKATPKIDYSGIEVGIAYGEAAVTGGNDPVVTGVYDVADFETVTLTENGEVYTALSVGAGGKITVTATGFTVENSDNYNEVVIVGKDVVVDKAAVTVSTVNRNVTYGDELAYAATDFYESVVGLVGGDSVTAEYSTAYVVGTAAGSVEEVVITFTFVSGNAENYVFNGGEPVKAQLTVGKRLINGSLVAPDSVYDGMPYDLAYIQSESIVEGDVVNCTVKYSKDNVSYVSGAPVDVGDYYAGITSVDNPNYEMGTIAGGVAFKITKAPAPEIVLTVRQDLVYDGKVKSVSDVVDVSVNGLCAGDESLAGHVSTLCLATMLNAGEYEIISTLSGLANYEDSVQAKATVVIGKAPVTVTLKDNGVIYGDALSNLVYYTGVEGLIGSDTFSVTEEIFSEEYVAGQTAAGTVIEVQLVYTVDNADNYVVNGGEELKATLTVVKRVLAGSINAQSRVYDGTAYDGATAEWNNLVGGDTVVVTFEYSTNGKDYTTQAPVNAGRYYVRAAGVEDNGNYEVNALETAVFNISKAAAPVINATAKDVVYSGQLINPAGVVGYTVDGLVAGDEALADGVSAYCAETILNAGTYEIGLVLKGLTNYEDAQTVFVDLIVARADRVMQATARTGYGYIEISVSERDAVEYSFDGSKWQALPSDARLSVEVAPVTSVYLRYVQTQNYNATQASKVDAYITYDVLEEYVGRNYSPVIVSFENADEIATVLGWQDVAVGQKSDTYEAVVGSLQNKYDSLIDSAKETVISALNAGANLSGYQKLAATVISVSVGGLALAVGILAVKKRKGGIDNEK